MRSRTDFITQFAVMHGAYMSGHFAMVVDVDAHVSIREATAAREIEAEQLRQLWLIRSERSRRGWAMRKARLSEKG